MVMSKLTVAAITAACIVGAALQGFFVIEVLDSVSIDLGGSIEIEAP